MSEKKKTILNISPLEFEKAMSDIDHVVECDKKRRAIDKIWNSMSKEDNKFINDEYWKHRMDEDWKNRQKR